MLSQSENNNVEVAVSALLKKLNIRIKSDIISDELNKHPNYPSMLAISDVLTNFDLENEAFRVKPGNLSELKTPFIGHIKLDGGNFLVVNKIGGGYVWVSGDKWNNKKIPQDRFNNMFTGFVLTINKKSNGYDFATLFDRVKIPALAVSSFLVLISILVFHTSFFVDINWKITLLILVKTIGLATSILLLVEYINKNNPMIQRLCQVGAAGKANCNAILSSKAAEVFKGLSWSEVGFFYFAGTWLTLLFNNHSLSLIGILTVINFLTLPYTLYSIYYQAKIARQWCVFCCTVQGLLWLEFIAFFMLPKAILTLPDYKALSTLFISFSVPCIVWIILKPLFVRLQKLNPLKQQLQAIKYNTRLFNSMLHNQPKYSLPGADWSIVLGNAEASNSITVVSNPYCQPCAQTHKALDQLLERNNNLQARIIFSTDYTGNNKRSSVSNHLMTLNELHDKEIVKRALNDWYKQDKKDYNSWAELYPVEFKETNFDKLDKQSKWCNLAEVTGTPTLLLNGYRLPNTYTLSDLKYLLS